MEIDVYCGRCEGQMAFADGGRQLVCTGCGYTVEVPIDAEPEEVGELRSSWRCPDCQHCNPCSAQKCEECGRAQPGC